MVRAESGQKDRDQEDPVASLAEMYWHGCPEVHREGTCEVNSDTRARRESLRQADLDTQ